jgi:hypothetical protein
MVRTLDFHSNNVGSIPASLIMLSLKARKMVGHPRDNYTSHKKYKHLFPNIRPTNHQYIHYTLNFRSIIPITQHFNLPLFTLLNLKGGLAKSTNIVIKQSYLLLTWLFVFKKHNQVRYAPDTRPNARVRAGVYMPSVFIKPIRRSRFTIVKAPMAHKTFSQEQYLFQSHTLVTSFKLLVNPRVRESYTSANNTLYLLLLLKSERFFFETNLFFLQRMTISIPVQDRNLLKL